MGPLFTVIFVICFVCVGCAQTFNSGKAGQEKISYMIDNNKEGREVSKEEQEAREVVKSLVDAMISKDLITLDGILSQDFTLTHITGYEQSRAEWLEEVKRESMKYYSAKEDKISVSIKGDTAEVKTRYFVDARIWGSRNTWRLQQVMTLEKQNNQWKVLKSVATLF